MRTGVTGWSVISVVLLVLTACADNAKPASPAPPDAGDTRIAVSENEYSITLPRTDLTPGTYTFVVDNHGLSGHDLTINGPGVDVAKRMPRDSRAEVIVTLRPGTYELWCSIGNHRVRGMRQKVIVAG